MKKNQILTIPNLLSLLRLAMIPLMLWLYLVKEEYIWTAAVVILSGATDIADGVIVRKYHIACTSDRMWELKITVPPVLLPIS